MVSYVDICLFSQNLTTITQRLSRDEARDIKKFEEEIALEITRFGSCPPESYIPLYNGQYHIDFWLSQVEIFSVNSFVLEGDKCNYVTSYFDEDVSQAYDTMQWSRLHRGEAIINDWPTLKTLLRCVFLPLMEQLHTTVVLNHLPNNSPPSLPPKKKTMISTSNTTTQPPAAVNSDHLQKVVSLSSCSCSCSCSNNKDDVFNKIYAELERDVHFNKQICAELERDVQLQLLKVKIDKLALITKEIQAGQCSTMLPPPTTSSSTFHQEARPTSSFHGLYRTNY